MHGLTKKNAIACKRKFLRFFPKGFIDPKFYGWERGYKWETHIAWQKELNRKNYTKLLAQKKYLAIAATAVKIESRTHLLFSFEKMALRDAVKKPVGAKLFAKGLYEFLYGKGAEQERFEEFVKILAKLPRKQSRVLTWPVATVFGFIANPKKYIYLKPKVTQKAAKRYHYELDYKPGPNWKTYQNVIAFSRKIRKDLRALKPKDFIDLQSFIWVLGSEEYDE